MIYKIPLMFSPQIEGGFTVTSPVLSELVTEGDTIEKALENARDALSAVIEAYEDLGKPLPKNLLITDEKQQIWTETILATV
jgi:antitoxin HicB